MLTTLVVHAPDRPFAADLAALAAMILGPGRVATPDALTAADRAASFVLLVDDGGRGAPFASSFVLQHADWLRGAAVGVLTSATLDDAVAAALAARLGVPELLRAAVPPPMAHRPHRVHQEALEETVGQVVALERARNARAPSMPRDALLARVEALLEKHTTCVLAVGSRLGVRAVPTEYRYEGGHVVMVTEGGEKLAHVLANGEVGVAVYEPFTSWETVAGLQLAGRARVHRPGTDDHARLAALWGLDAARLAALPVRLYVIDVTPHRADLLDATLRAEGHAPHQTYVY